MLTTAFFVRFLQRRFGLFRKWTFLKCPKCSSEFQTPKFDFQKLWIIFIELRKALAWLAVDPANHNNLVRSCILSAGEKGRADA